MAKSGVSGGELVRSAVFYPRMYAFAATLSVAFVLAPPSRGWTGIHISRTITRNKARRGGIDLYFQVLTPSRACGTSDAPYLATCSRTAAQFLAGRRQLRLGQRQSVQNILLRPDETRTRRRLAESDCAAGRTNHIVPALAPGPRINYVTVDEVAAASMRSWA